MANPYGIVGYKPPKKDPFAFPSYAPGKIPNDPNWDAAWMIPEGGTWGGTPLPGGPGSGRPIPPGGSRPGQITFGGNIPDYLSGIEGDWEYQAALRDIEGADAAQRAATQEAIKGLAVGWGGDLSQLLQRGLIDQTTADMASKNEFSTMKELGRNLQRGNAQALDRLAARGAASSGALPVLNAFLNEDYQRQSSQAAANVLSAVNQAQSSLAQGMAERRANLQGTRSSVASRLAQMAMLQATPRTTARWNGTAYEDEVGRLYNQDGTPYWG